MVVSRWTLRDGGEDGEELVGQDFDVIGGWRAIVGMCLLYRFIKCGLIGLVGSGYLLLLVESEKSESGSIVVTNHCEINVIAGLFELYWLRQLFAVQ